MATQQNDCGCQVPPEERPGPGPAEAAFTLKSDLFQASQHLRSVSVMMLSPVQAVCKSGLMEVTQVYISLSVLLFNISFAFGFKTQDCSDTRKKYIIPNKILIWCYKRINYQLLCLIGHPLLLHDFYHILQQHVYSHVLNISLVLCAVWPWC